MDAVGSKYFKILYCLGFNLEECQMRLSSWKKVHRGKIYFIMSGNEEGFTAVVY